MLPHLEIKKHRIEVMEISVNDGQSIWDICVRYYGDVGSMNKLLKDNKLTYDSELYAGQKLFIRDSNNGTKSFVTEFFDKSNSTINNGFDNATLSQPIPIKYSRALKEVNAREITDTWIVQDGQSLYDIAVQLYGDVQLLPILHLDNNLTYDDSVEAGDVIKIRPELVVLAINQTVINNNDNVDLTTGELRVTVKAVGAETNFGNGYILINVFGGLMPYTYQWFNPLNELIKTTQNLVDVASNTYTIIVTDSLNDTATLTVNIPAIYIEYYLVDEGQNILIDEVGDYILSIE